MTSTLNTTSHTESLPIRLVAYHSGYRADFKRLNERWIREYFRMETSDHQSLNDPDTKIIQPGGYIVMALEGDKPVGTCALIPMDDGGYELAKMAVDPECQGKGVGKLIGQHMVEMGTRLKAKRLFLESNTRLTPAINLYRKLGFVEIRDRSSCYERCNIQMERRYD